MHTFPNDKKYIGITKEDRIEKRWGTNGSGYFHNRQFAMENAIKKYGWENVRHEILACNLTEKESKELEIYYINYYDTYGCNGYNMTPGGDNRSFMRGSNNPSSKIVVCNGVEYETMSSFCNAFHLKPSIVSMWLNGKEPMPKKYYDLHLHYKGKTIDHIVVQNGRLTGVKNSKSRAVIYRNIKYDTLKDFCSKYNVNKDTVRNWMIGKSPMPQVFYDGSLRYDDSDMSKAIRSIRKSKFDNVYTEPN